MGTAGRPVDTMCECASDLASLDDQVGLPARGAGRQLWLTGRLSVLARSIREAAAVRRFWFCGNALVRSGGHLTYMMT